MHFSRRGKGVKEHGRRCKNRIPVVCASSPFQPPACTSKPDQKWSKWSKIVVDTRRNVDIGSIEVVLGCLGGFHEGVRGGRGRSEAASEPLTNHLGQRDTTLRWVRGVSGDLLRRNCDLSGPNGVF